MRILLLALLLLPVNVFADALYQADDQGIRITLYDEPCKLDAVKNLKFRAVWTEKGRDIEGCVGLRPDAGVVVAYFADKTVALIPMEIFRSVTGT